MTSFLTAELVSCGTELLMGQILNTNAQYLSQALPEIGVRVEHQTTVGDHPKRLAAVIRQALLRSDLVIITGGLGPTEDDITMATVAEVFGQKLIEDERAKRHIEDYFNRLGKVPTKNNFKQALLPEKAHILPNQNGTAPGAWLESETGQILVLLPGPPSEMQIMFQTYVVPKLAVRTTDLIRSTYVRIVGMGESEVVSRLADLIDHQTNPTLAPYCSIEEVLLRISEAQPKNTSLHPAQAFTKTKALLEIIQSRLGDRIYEIGDRSLPQVLLDELAARNLRLGFAESCTGGMAASGIAQLPGASAVLAGGIIAYSNTVKIQCLDVREDSLNQWGAVSEVVAQEMALGLKNKLNVDLALSITGIAGPDGGSQDKPVGLVYIGLVDQNQVTVKKFQFSGDRKKIQTLACVNAYDLIRQTVLRPHQADK